MRKNIKLLLFILCLLFFSVLPALAAKSVNDGLIQFSPGEKEWIKENPVIQVANEDDWPPFDFSELGKPLGFSIDIADLVAEKTGLKFQYTNGYTWADLYNMAISGKIDLLPCIGKSPEREQYFFLTKAYFDDPIVVFVRKDAPPFRSMKDLLDKRLAVVQDYSVTDNIKANYPDIRLAHVPSPAAALRAISEGRVDAFAGTMSVGNYEMNKNGFQNVRIGGRADIKGMGDSAFYMAIPKKLPELASIVQKGLDAITEEEKQRVLRKWEIVSTSLDKPLFRLSDKEKSWLADLGELVLGIHPDASPYSFVDSQGRYAGLSADFTKVMAKRLGISIKPVNNREWNQILSGVKLGSIDIVAFGQNRLHEKNDGRVTQPYMQDPIVIITRKDAHQIAGVNGLKGKSVGYTKAQLSSEFIQRDYSGLNLINFPSLEKGLISLDKKEIAALLSTITAFEYHRRKIDVESLKVVATTPLTFKPAFEVREGLEPLVEILNKYITTISDEQLNLLAQSWRNVQVEKHVDLKIVLSVIAVVSFVGLTIVLFFAYTNRRLSKEIKERIKAEKERRLLEEQLRNAQKMEAIGSLAGGIAHDFNNILSSIIGFSELVQEKLQPGSQTYAMQEQIMTAGLRARDLVQQILLFSRQSDQEKRPVQVHLILKEALKLLRASIPATIEIKKKIPADCSQIIGDPTQIHQIVMNLCTNAYHAMSETGGTLEISLSEINITPNDISFSDFDLNPGAYIIISVADTGQGMDASTMEKIFDPYFTTKSKGEGTGLGLSVVHGIVKSMEGHIKVYSELEKGTNIQVYLPSIAGDDVKSEKLKTSNLPTGNESICIIDDEKPILEMMKIGLEKLGYTVQTYVNAQDALDAFKLDPDKFDIIISDLTMPNMNGVELVKQITILEPNFPVILCTGFSELINKEKAETLGVKSFLTKPVLFSDLAFAIRNAL